MSVCLVDWANTDVDRALSIHVLCVMNDGTLRRVLALTEKCKAFSVYSRSSKIECGSMFSIFLQTLCISFVFSPQKSRLGVSLDI